MNSLDELRHTLELHSHDVAAVDPLLRRHDVSARIASARRRRNVVRGGVALASVAAVAGALALPNLVGQDRTGPADRAVLGLEAPTVLETPMNTYRFVQDFEDPQASSLEVEVEYSDESRILTWATAGADQDVSIVGADGQPWSSTRADFDDWVAVPEGFSGQVTITTDRGTKGLGAALYVADPSALPEVVEGFHGQYFRAETPTARRLGVAVGERGETELRLPYRDAGPHLSVMVSCEGLPAGLTIRTKAGREMGSDTEVCQGDGAEGRSFVSLPKDLGSLLDNSQSTKDGDDWPDGEARVWITDSDNSPIDPADHPDVRLAAAVYTTSGETETVPDSSASVPRAVWHQGHEWELARTEADVANQPQEMRADTAQAPVLAAIHTRDVPGRTASMGVTVDGEPLVATTGQLTPGTPFSTTGVLPRGAAVLESKVEGRKGATVAAAQSLLVYRLVR